MHNPRKTEDMHSTCVALINMNICWLRQALSLISKLEDKAYTTAPGELVSAPAGAHLRHVVEFYRCFMNGLEARHIDYDARERDKSIEQSRAAACAAIRKLIHFLETSESLGRESPIWIRMEDADAHEAGRSFIPSSISRELQALSSHTIHHFALIAMTLRLHGVKIESDFGVAPSTLRYRESRAARRAEAA